MTMLLGAVAVFAAAIIPETPIIHFTPQDDPAQFTARVRAFRAEHPEGPVTVRLAKGVYTLRSPLVFTPEDSGSANGGTRWEGEGAIISGGVAIDGWTAEADGTWSATLPKDAAGEPIYFEQLFVNGRRASRSRLPDEGFFTLENLKRVFLDGNGAVVEKSENAVRERDELTFRADDVAKIAGMSADDARYAQLLCNFNWERLRLPMSSVVYVANRHTLEVLGKKFPPWAPLKKDDLYAFENVRAAFDAPGEWFYDGVAGKVRYRPLPGEQLAGKAPKFIAPVTMQELVMFKGDAPHGRYVEHLTFRGIEFAHSAPIAHAERGPSLVRQSQAAAGVCSAAVVADGARDLKFLDCEFRHLGSYAVWFREGCKRCVAECCLMEDLGAGGVRIGAMVFSNPALAPKGPVVSTNHYCAISTESNRVANCVIRAGGRFHPQGVGVFVTHASDNVITHNEITDLFYTGVSVGWVWGYGGSVSQRNEISFNRIHKIGQGQLADMGGVYLLGTSFGTRVANNVVFDVDSYSYGGWGLYPDEGSEGEIWENNLVYDTKDASFHQHYGRDNIVRNNILCYSRQGQVAVTRAEPHRSLTVERNIIYWDEGPTFLKYGGTLSEKAQIEWKGNLWWKERGEVEFNGKTFAQWQEKGRDTEGAVADPKFVDAAKRDFRLRPDSPALKLGFKPFDPSAAGVDAAQAKKYGVK